MANFSVIKLKTGETLFCESNLSPVNNHYVDVSDPFLVKTIELENNTESLYASKWVPFTAYNKFSIPMDAIVLIAPLNRAYKRFYGLTHLKAELYDLNSVAANRILKGESHEHVLSEIFSQMDSIHTSITGKIGELEFDLNSFKSYVEKQLADLNETRSANFNFEAFEEEDEDDKKPILH